ncbi:MAG: PHB depolymerase family esterase [Myxococcales bacterium]|nr:hypothetical protein [Myxococcales bacterium]
MRVLGTVLALIGLPAALALAEAVSFYAANRSNGTIGDREYLLHVPPRYDRSKPTPLVISMHGAGLWPAAQMEISRWNEVADRHGFIVVYPAGTKGSGPRVWHVDRGPGLMRDVKFIGALIDELAARYNIDPKRIYADGLSNGGGMAFVLSCTLSDRIAAVGTVGAAQLLPFSWCPDRRPVPMINFHGTDDRAAPYKGGASWVTSEPFPGVLAWTREWARRNRCAPNASDSAVAEDVTRRAYRGCAGDADVVLYTVQGGGHTWPGGTPMPEWFVGRTSDSIDASSLMWEFFRQHPLVSR